MSSNAWQQLTVDFNSSVDPFKNLVPEFWLSAITALEKEGIEMGVPNLDDVPLFHVRRTPNCSLKPASIELFRLNSSATKWFSRFCVVIEGALPNQCEFGIASPRWDSLNGFNQSNRFFTFIQACTVLRIKWNIHAPEGLAHSDRHLDALACMREPNQPWSSDLAPWFNHLDTMTGNLAYQHDNASEYAHWFGHILSE